MLISDLGLLHKSWAETGLLPRSKKAANMSLTSYRASVIPDLSECARCHPSGGELGSWWNSGTAPATVIVCAGAIKNHWSKGALGRYRAPVRKDPAQVRKPAFAKTSNRGWRCGRWSGRDLLFPSRPHGVWPASAPTCRGAAAGGLRDDRSHGRAAGAAPIRI